MMPDTDDFDFIAFDDLEQDSDEFGFVPFEPVKQQRQPSTEFIDQFESGERSFQQENIHNQNSENPQEKSFVQDVLLKSLKDIPKNTSGQIALGLSQGATAPLDLMKMYLIGEGLTGLEEAQEASERMGIPFDMEKEKEKFLSAMEYLPTQQLAEQYLKKTTGVETEPQNMFDKVLRGVAEFGGAPKLGKNLKLEPKKLGAEQHALKETAEEFGLKQFAGMESEKAPSITPVVSKEKQAKLAKELGDTSKKAVDEVIEQKIPIKKLRDMGTNLEEAYTKSYEMARNTASKMGEHPIEYRNVIDWIDKEIKGVKQSAPSLSKQQQTYIDVLQAEKKNFLQKPIKGETGSINLITGKKEPVSLKKIDANQVLTQYKYNNNNVKGIYRKPEFSGSEEAVKSAYAGLNEQLIKALEKANPHLAEELKNANRIFHETSKLEQVEGILSKAFKDGYNPKKLDQIVGSKRGRKFLERSIGKDGVQDLERIAKYGNTAEKKVFEQLKNPKTAMEYIKNITPMGLALLVGYKAHIGSVYYVGKEVLQRIQGQLFTREATRKNYIKFLKDAAQSSSPYAIIQSAKKLNDSIIHEFGSEEELMEMSQSEE